MRQRLIVAFVLFFASGMAGLVYQVVWARLLTLVIGVSIFAITAVICTYMAGLALGAYVIGRSGARLGDPLRVYGVLEALVGIYAALTPWIFAGIEPIYVWGFRTLDGPVLDAFRIVLSALVLLIPTALMGGTLPLLSSAVASVSAKAVRGVGRLYAVNTFGAVAGCLLAGFVLLAELGVRSSLYVTAALNLTIAAVAFLAPRAPVTADVSSAASHPTLASAPAPTTGSGREGAPVLLALVFLTGFAALGYEVLWTRALLVYVKSSTYAFSLMLSVYLVGVALGSMLVSGRADRARNPLTGFAACQLGIVATVALSLTLFPDLKDLGLSLVGSARIDSFGRAVALMFAQASVVLLLPTIFMGASFPFAVATYHDASRDVGRSVGSLYAVNTAGNIAGSIVVGFFLIALLGVRNSLLLMIFVNLSVAVFVFVRSARSIVVRGAIVTAAAAVLLVVHLSVSPFIFLDSLWARPGTEVIYYVEGASDTVAVFETSKPRKKRTLVYSDGRGAAGTSSLLWNLYFGHLPMVLHENPQQVLHICYGSGNSVLALTRHDPARVDVVELSPHVRDASPLFWTNENVLEDPRVQLIIADGRNYLLGTDRRYDVISLEPPNVYTSGVVNLYTQEFYELARERMNPGGIFVQWLPTAQLGDADRRHLIRAMTEAFPHVTVWQQLIGPTLLLVGTLEPLAVDLDEIDRRLAAPAMRRDVRVMGTPDAASFLAYFLRDDASTRAWVADYEPVRDDRTIVDYSIPQYVGSGFGLAATTYAVRDDEQSAIEASQARTIEYAEWSVPASAIVPDAAQAARVDAAMLRRKQAARGVIERLKGAGS